MKIAHHWVQIHNKALSTVYIQLCLIQSLWWWFSASPQYSMKIAHYWVQIHNKVLSTQPTLFYLTGGALFGAKSAKKPKK